jgi:hypothetical protein
MLTQLDLNLASMQKCQPISRLGWFEPSRTFSEISFILEGTTEKAYKFYTVVVLYQVRQAPNSFNLKKDE